MDRQYRVTEELEGTVIVRAGATGLEMKVQLFFSRKIPAPPVHLLVEVGWPIFI